MNLTVQQKCFNSQNKRAKTLHCNYTQAQRWYLIMGLFLWSVHLLLQFWICGIRNQAESILRTRHNCCYFCLLTGEEHTLHHLSLPGFWQQVSKIYLDYRKSYMTNVQGLGHFHQDLSKIKFKNPTMVYWYMSSQHPPEFQK